MLNLLVSIELLQLEMDTFMFFVLSPKIYEIQKFCVPHSKALKEFLSMKSTSFSSLQIWAFYFQTEDM